MAENKTIQSRLRDTIVLRQWESGLAYTYTHAHFHADYIIVYAL